MVDQVSDYAGTDHNQSKQERTHAEHNFVFAADDGKSQQQNWRNANRDRSKQATRHTKWTLQFGLANAQADQGHKFKRQAGAVDHNVERDQSFESEIQGETPTHRQRQNRDPGRTRFWMQLAQNFLQ